MSSSQRKPSPIEEIALAIANDRLIPYGDSYQNNTTLCSLLSNAAQVVLMPVGNGHSDIYVVPLAPLLDEDDSPEPPVDTEELTYIRQISSWQSVENVVNSARIPSPFSFLVITPTFSPNGTGINSSRAEVYAA